MYCVQDSGVPLASDQVQFSLLYRKHEKEGLLAKAKELGVSVIAYSPLSQGLLTGKLTPSGAAFQSKGVLCWYVSPRLALPSNVR